MASAREIGTTLKEIRAYCEKNGVRIVDFRFTDVPGTWEHFSAPLSQVDDAVFTEGLGFDGSSIRGFQQIQESDMILVPDPTSVFLDPAMKVPAVVMICDVRDPITGGPYSRDPRYVARKAEEYLKSTGIADVSYWGPELEHFIFDSASFDQDSHSAHYFIDSEEGIWNSGERGERGKRSNLAHRPDYKGGYFPVPPTDRLQDIRSEAILQMIDCGIDVEIHHHEVATAGQGEIDMRYGSLTRMADQVMLHKYILKNVAHAHGKVATFMPKPLFGDNGTGMHVHQSLWKGGKPLFFDKNGYALTSEMCRHYIGGLLRHAPALLSLIAPGTNSYRRLVPGYEAPVNLVYSARNRSAAARIPMYSSSPAAKRIEFRPPDPTCNPYLAFSAMLMAGLDGVVRKLDPGRPVEKNLYDLPPREAARIKQVPGSLAETLSALERDHDFLLQGGVFTRDLIETWIERKRAEADEVRLRPHPYEFHLYLDA